MIEDKPSQLEEISSSTVINWEIQEEENQNFEHLENSMDVDNP